MASDRTVLLAKAQTLTNKTLTSPRINTPTVNEDVALTATATELNLMDGCTATTAELNLVDGVTSTTAELNILDGVTATKDEINTACDGITATAAELNQLDDVEVGGTSSGDIVDTDTAQTLTNKTIISLVLTTPQINDTTKDHQYVVAVSELTADRTVTLPSLTGADEFVFKAHTQTLTNKTLASPVLNTTATGTAIGIADNKLVVVDDADAANEDFARFTATGLQGRSPTEVRSDCGGLARIKTGTYTGDGSISQAITGVGFRPKSVEISCGAAAAITDGVSRTDAYANSVTYARGVATGGTINSLDADGFTVDDGGGDLFPNKNAMVYFYKALG